jgi:CDGSH-type Zn-finger protein
MPERDTTGGIAVRPHGPYRVSGGVPLTRRRIVYSEHGEPMTWQTVERSAPGPDYVLCRCGQSAAKPYCDGSHAAAGFDGTEAPPAGSYDDRAVAMAGTGIIVRDDRAICVHAGFCGNRVSNVWKLVRGSGTDDSITRAQVMAMVERCPSGALTYRLEPDGDDIEPELREEITVIPDGPLWVTGRVPVTLTNGERLEGRNRVTLCRCGASAAKPLCDGSHTTIGFSDATQGQAPASAPSTGDDAASES